MLWHVARNRRAVLLFARAPLLLALCCGPALQEHQLVQSIDGREYRVLSTQGVALEGGTRLLRIDYESRALDDRAASRKEARSLLRTFGNQLAQRKHVMIVANSEPLDLWSDEREQIAFLFGRTDGKWEIVAEDVPALAQLRLE